MIISLVPRGGGEALSWRRKAVEAQQSRQCPCLRHGALLERKGSGNTRQRRCLSREGSGDTRQRQRSSPGRAVSEARRTAPPSPGRAQGGPAQRRHEGAVGRVDHLFSAAGGAITLRASGSVYTPLSHTRLKSSPARTTCHHVSVAGPAPSLKRWHAGSCVLFVVCCLFLLHHEWMPGTHRRRQAP